MVGAFERRLGRELAKRREYLGLSQEGLAQLCQLHRTYISAVERGIKSPTVRTLRLFASALNTRASDLLATAEGSEK